MNTIEQEKLAMIILGIIADSTMRPGRGSYIASWDIEKRLEALGYSDVSIGSRIPQTDYDKALNHLVDEGVIEVMPDLPQRYRLKRKEAQKIGLA